MNSKFTITSILAITLLLSGKSIAQTTASININIANDRDTTISGTSMRVFDVQAMGANGYDSATANTFGDNANGTFESIQIVFNIVQNGNSLTSSQFSDFKGYPGNEYTLLSPSSGSSLISVTSSIGTYPAIVIQKANPLNADLSTTQYKTIARIAYPSVYAGTTVNVLENSSPFADANYSTNGKSFWNNSNNINSLYDLAVVGVNSIVLPINYKYFTAEAKGANALLNWETATETNNAYFEIQRSFDGISFTKIGQVKGSGTTSAAVDYAYTDVNPNSKIVYYRLNQVDMDGHAHLSDIKRVLFSGNNTPTIVYPNPSNTGLVNIELGSNTTKVIIWDVLGRKVTELTKNGAVQLTTGNYIAQSLNNDGTTYTNRMSVIGQK